MSTTIKYEKRISLTKFHSAEQIAAAAATHKPELEVIKTSIFGESYQDKASKPYQYNRYERNLPKLRIVDIERNYPMDYIDIDNLDDDDEYYNDCNIEGTGTSWTSCNLENDDLEEELSLDEKFYHDMYNINFRPDEVERRNSQEELEVCKIEEEPVLELVLLGDIFNMKFLQRGNPPEPPPRPPKKTWYDFTPKKRIGLYDMYTFMAKPPSYVKRNSLICQVLAKAKINVHPLYDNMIGNMEAVLLLIWSLSSISNPLEYIPSLLLFAKTFCMPYQLLEKYMEINKFLLSNMFSTPVAMAHFNPARAIREWIDGTSDGTDPVSKNLTVLFTWLLTTSFAPKILGEMRANDIKDWMSFAFKHDAFKKTSALEALLFLIEGGWESIFYMNHAWMHTKSSYKLWFTQVERLGDEVKNLKFIENGESEEYASLDLFKQKMMLLFLQGEEMLCESEKGNLNSSSMVNVRESMRKLVNIRGVFRNYCASKSMRAAPFVIVIQGDPGVGKNSINYWFAQQFCALYRLGRHDGNTYEQMNSDLRYDAYDEQAVFFINDPDAIQPSLTGPMHKLVMLQDLVNNSAMNLPVAHLEKKGNTMFKSELIVITTNHLPLKTSEIFTDPIACGRRLEFAVVVELKKKHKEGNVVKQFDIADFDSIEETYIFHIERFRSVGSNGEYVRKKEESNLNITDAMKIFNKATALHRDRQAQVMRNKAFANMSTMCPHDLLEFMCKECNRSCSDCYDQTCEKCMTVLYDEIDVFKSGLMEYHELPEAKGFAPLLLGGAYMFYSAAYKMDPISIAQRFATRAKFLHYMNVPVQMGPVEKICAKSINKLSWFLKDKKIIRDENDFYYNCVEAMFFVSNFVTFASSIALHVYVAKWIANMVMDSFKTKKKEEALGDTFSSWTDPNISLFTNTQRSSSVKEVVNYVSNCYYEVRTIGKYNNRCICAHLFSGFFITVRHIFPVEEDGNQSMLFFDAEYPVLQKIFIPDKDLCIFRCAYKPNRGIWKFVSDIQTTHSFDSLSVTAVLNRVGGERPVTIEPKSGIAEYQDKLLYKVEADAMSIPTKRANQILVTKAVSKGGSCGSLLFRTNGQHIAIEAILFAGLEHETLTFYQSVDFALIKAEISEMLKLPITLSSAIDPCYTWGSPFPKVYPLSSKSFLNWSESKPLEVIGSVLGHGQELKESRVKRTAFFDVVNEMDSRVSDRTIPIFSSFKQTRPSPKQYNLKKLCMEKSTIPKEHLDAAYEDYLLDIGHLRMALPITLDEAINGWQDQKGLTMNTSFGFPRRGKKKTKMLGKPGAYCFNTEDMIVIDKMEKNYRKGVRNRPVFTGSLKDEHVSVAKNDLGALRMFQGCSAYLLALMGKYFTPFVQLFKNSAKAFGTAFTSNSFSLSWAERFYYLTAFGKNRMIAGDFVGFDKGMSWLEIMTAFATIEYIAVRSGYPAEDILAMRTMMEDVAEYACCIKGDLMVFMGNPSGQFLTTPLNDLVNQLRHRCGFLYLHPNLRFSEYVHLNTFGDDSVAGVSTEVKFSHSTFTEYLLSYGVEYTMADKTSVSVPYVHVSDIEFLKRRFVETTHEGVPIVTDALRVDSVLNMLAWGRKNDISPFEQERIAFQNVERELLRQPQADADHIESILLKCYDDHKERYGVDINRDGYDKQLIFNMIYILDIEVDDATCYHINQYGVDVGDE